MPELKPFKEVKVGQLFRVISNGNVGMKCEEFQHTTGANTVAKAKCRAIMICSAEPNNPAYCKNGQGFPPNDDMIVELLE